MKSVKFLVSLFNDTPVNDSYFFDSYLDADLAATKALKEGRYGMLYRIETNANASYEKEVRTFLRGW